MDIQVKTIAATKQRYDTLGDWFDVKRVYPCNEREPDYRTVITVSELSDPTYEFLIALHELIEMYLCRARGISSKTVDEFDLNWQGDGEPGNDPSAPYFKEHQFAFMIERLMAHELGVDWEEYEKRCDEVLKGK